MTELETIEDIPYYNINIPDLNKNPYIIKSEILNNRTYYFEYLWNIRHNKAYISIYFLSNNNKIYLIRNITLLPMINITKYVYDFENWSGSLYFDAIDLAQTFNYNQENISSEYILRYIP